MDSHTSRFSGRILERGFWLYVWRVWSSDREVWYVGRTGDNSSANAASPFGRLSQHLDLRENTTANTLVRNLRANNLEPCDCEFELLAIGPLYSEQESFEDHVPFRDATALLEAELAEYIRLTDRIIIGSHPRRGTYDEQIFEFVKEKVGEFLDNNPRIH